MPDDSIMDMVNNIESFYNDKNAMYDKWVEEGDAWGERQARKEALALASHFAEAIESMEGFDEKYGESDFRQAADEMLEEFEEYRDEVIKEVVSRTSTPLKPEEYMMDPGDIEHAKKYEELSQRIGIEELKSLIPVSPEKIRSALSRGDQHLNTIQLRKWDAAAMRITFPGLSLAQKVSALKHVARWHYA